MNYRTVDYPLYQPHGDYYMEGEVPPGPSETHGKDKIGHGQVENPLNPQPPGVYNPRSYRRRQREQQEPGGARKYPAANRNVPMDMESFYSEDHQGQYDDSLVGTGGTDSRMPVIKDHTNHPPMPNPWRYNSTDASPPDVLMEEPGMTLPYGKPPLGSGANYLRKVHHEQSETVDVPGGYSQVYGKKTPKAGQPIPKRYDFEKPVYPNLQEALGSAIVRSDLEGRRMGAAGLRHR